MAFENVAKKGIILWVVVGVVVLILLVVGAVKWHRYENWGGRGMMAFNQDFGKGDRELPGRAGRGNFGMMNWANNVVNTANSQVVNEFTGKFSFNLDGKAFELPYSVKDKQMKLDLSSLKEFIKSAAGQKVNLRIVGPNLQNKNQFATEADFTKTELTFDYVQGARYLVNLQVLDAQGTVTLDVNQML